MVPAPTCAYGEADARFSRSGPRTIMVTAELHEQSSGTLFYQGNLVAPMSLSVGDGQVAASHNGLVVATLDLTDSAETHMYHIAWVTEENPDTTGPVDAYISWLMAWDVHNGVALRSVPFRHNAKEASIALVCWGARRADGLDAFDGVITRAGFHHRVLTLSEIHDDYVATAVPLETATVVERPHPPLSLASGLGARNELHGPVYAWAADQHHRLRRRTSTGRTMRCAPPPVSGNWHVGNPRVRFAPHSADYHMVIGWLWPLPVQPIHSHIWVRVHAEITSSEDPVMPVGLRVYSSNKPPMLAQPGGEPYAQSDRGTVVEGGTPAGGAWVFEQLVPIERGREGLREGWTYVSLAYAMFPAIDLADATLRVNAVQIVPCAVPIGGGGIHVGA